MNDKKTTTADNGRREMLKIELDYTKIKLQQSEDERRAKVDDKLFIGNELARFLMGTIFLYLYVCIVFSMVPSRARL